MKKKTYEEIKEIVCSKGLADDNAVAIAKLVNLGWYTAFGYVEEGKWDLIFTSHGDYLVIIPIEWEGKFVFKPKVAFQRGVKIHKSKIVSLTIEMFGARFILETTDKKKNGYSIQIGTKDFKQIAKNLGFVNK